MKTAKEQYVGDGTNKAAGTANKNTISVSINGFEVVLDPTKSPPTSSELFHAMFFVQELDLCPVHYRQQRWNARRIEKRWQWKRGKEREVYDKRACFLRNKWLELKEDLKSNGNQCLSEQFLEQNERLQFNDTDVEEEGTRSEHNKENCDPAAVAMSSSQRLQQKQQQQAQPAQQSEDKSRILKKLDNKRKQIRQKEKLVQRIANGEPMEDFVDFEKYAKMQKTKKCKQPGGSAVDDLFDGIIGKKQKTKHKSKKHSKKNAVKLSEFREENQPHSDFIHSHGAVSTKSSSLHAIQAEQLADFVCTQRQKRTQIHTAVLLETQTLTASPALSAVSDCSHTSSVSSTSTVPMISASPADLYSNRELQCSILNFPCSQFRQKCMNDIYCGCSVFSYVPCCVDATNTLLIDAQFIESMLRATAQTLSSLDGLLCFKKKLKKRFGDKKSIEILPIFERAYVDKKCTQLLLVKFYETASDALTLFHIWKQHMQAINQEHIKIGFVPNWFSNAFFLQHAHVWSDLACDAHLAVYENNEKYISNIHHKYARHCHCVAQPIVYFPAFHPQQQQQQSRTRTHDVHCAFDCCCCVFYNDPNNACDAAHNTIVPGDIVVWNAKRGIALGAVNGFSQDYKIQINVTDDANVVTAQYKYIVPLSALQRLCDERSATATECARTITEHQFSALHQITDDISFVSYIKKFWNL